MARKPIKRWKRIVRKIILLIVLLALLAGGLLYAYGELVSSVTTTYDEYTTSTGSISNALSFSGNFALVSSKTYAASSAATVRNVYVSAGEDVREGDKLVRLSSGEMVKADFDGRVNAVSVTEGDVVAVNAALVQLADFEHMTVSIRVDEYDIADVSVGQKCAVVATATEKTFEGVIDSINYISASSGTVAYYTAVASVEVSEGIYPGMQATISITQSEANDVVVLKVDALSYDRTNSAYVFTKNDAGEMEQVFVTLGVSNGNYVEIADGLSAGQTVYVEAAEEEASSAASLLASLFGGRSQVRNMNGAASFGGENFSMPEGFTMPEGAGGGSMPSFGGNSGGNSGASSGGNSGGGTRGGMGGGGQ